MKKILVAVLCLGISTTAIAASPEEAYFAARDAAIEQLTKSVDSQTREQYIADNDKAEAALTQQLTQIIGPVAIKTFAKAGKINVGSLVKGDADFGQLDGLEFKSVVAPTTTLVVSTEKLAGHWLVEHKTWWSNGAENVPQAIPDALKSNAFYTQAMSTDAAVSLYATLPIVQPVNISFAYAALAAGSQDELQLAPTELYVSVIIDGRILVANAVAKTKIGPIAACNAIWKSGQAKVKAQAAKPAKDDPDGAKSRQIEAERDKAFLSCYAAKAASVTAKYPALTAQAQAIADTLAGK